MVPVSEDRTHWRKQYPAEDTEEKTDTQIRGWDGPEEAGTQSHCYKN